MSDFLNKRIGLIYVFIFLVIALIGVLVYSDIANAQEAEKQQHLTFAWDANTEKDLAGYLLYRSDTPGVYTYGPGNALATIEAGTETTVLNNVKPGYFVLTAFDKHGNESGPSNEVESLPPGDPSGFKITVTIEVNS